jgi:hypothetical protein
VDGAIIWRFKRAPNEENNTVYSGVISRNVMSGIMFSTTGGKGHWYAIKKGTKKKTPHSPIWLKNKQKPKLT